MPKEQKASENNVTGRGKKMPENRKPEDGKREEPTYEIIDRIALIKETKDKKHRTELNRIKWDGKPAVFDLRVWVMAEDGNYKPTTKGVRMYYEDVLMLSKVLVDL